MYNNMEMKRIATIFLQISLGWLMFYAGVTKILNPAWSAEGYLKGAKTFSGFYTSLTSPSVLPFVNFLNEWGLTLIGVALLAGIMVRWASIGGVLLMLLYYFPVLAFPKVGEHSYIVDEHVIYIGAFLMLMNFHKAHGFSLKWVIDKGE